ncbi:MAG: hypothetical protein AAGA03_07875, partial [Planctomycetota bacterium]
ADDAAQARRDALVVRALERISHDRPLENPKVQAAIQRHIARVEGTSEYLKLLKKYSPDGAGKAFERVLLTTQDDSAAVDAVSLLLEPNDGYERVKQLILGAEPALATRLTRMVAISNNGKGNTLLLEIAADKDYPFEARCRAMSGVCRNSYWTERFINDVVKAGKLPADAKPYAAGVLAQSPNLKLRREAAEYLPLPQQVDRKPLAPLDQLAKMPGDVQNGMKLFRSVGTCSNCHIVNDFGKEVGPNLSEIGSKLSREAMFTSILAPSAGISHNYESYILLTESGQVISGLKVGETADQVTIRTVDAIDRTVPQDEIVELKKSEKSIMPENLHHTTDQQGLIDLVEYLMTLKKKA